ncbi:YfgM family protein [Candidiatus Paracoxiella cheracis]|uniref:YfgM family protein n=1 Tax=Candidiatus Paracoxiella cheracis TaxID=3405120 RepID=UPI003BF5BD32
MSDLTDKEQVEMIKKWWREYGLVITVAVVIGLAVGFGWRYWHRHKVMKAEEASIIYTEMQNAAAQNKFDDAQALASRLMTHYRNTPYAGMSALLWARDAVLQNKLNVALEKLQWTIKNGKMASVKQIARVRAARILLAEKQYQPALTLLKTVDDPTYQPLINSVKGDIYRARGNNKLAKQAYQAAKNGFETSGIVDPFLNMKVSQ